MSFRGKFFTRFEGDDFDIVIQKIAEVASTGGEVAERLAISQI
jgi:hypothetical protein